MNSEDKQRLSRQVFDANAVLNARAEPKPINPPFSGIPLPQEPILIASTEGLGTHRVRANHFDAFLDYCSEQEKLKNAGAPM